MHRRLRCTVTQVGAPRPATLAHNFAQMHFKGRVKKPARDVFMTPEGARIGQLPRTVECVAIKSRTRQWNFEQTTAHCRAPDGYLVIGGDPQDRRPRRPGRTCGPGTHSPHRVRAGVATAGLRPDRRGLTPGRSWPGREVWRLEK